MRTTLESTNFAAQVIWTFEFPVIVVTFEGAETSFVAARDGKGGFAYRKPLTV